MIIEKFRSSEELCARICEDIESLRISAVRFPVRFIFLDSFGDLKAIVKYLAEELKVKTIELGELLSNKKEWLTVDEIVSLIKKQSDNAVIIPLSEFLRFENYEDFYATLKGLTEIEKNNINIRIYVPLVGLWERFNQEFWSKYYRKDEWAPIWKLECNRHRLTLYKIGFDLKDMPPVSNAIEVPDTKIWFNVWKKMDATRILLTSTTLALLYENIRSDLVFEVNDVPNPKKFIEEFFEVEFPMEFRNDEERFWIELAGSIKKYKERSEGKITFMALFLDYFNLKRIDDLCYKDLVNMFLNHESEYDYWLFKNVFIAYCDERYPYLSSCFKELKTLKKDELVERIWLHIFDFVANEVCYEIFDERREILNALQKESISTAPIEVKLEDRLNTELTRLPLKKQLQYLTNITFIERKFIVSVIKSFQNAGELYSDLKKVYPELAYYLDWGALRLDEEIPGWIVEYFKEYNLSKVKHEKSAKLQEILDEKNKNKSAFSEWFYSIPPVQIDEESKLIWIDGLGVEWFPYLERLFEIYCEEKGKQVVKQEIVRVNLPSTTECNNYPCEKKEDLDRFIHSGVYKYPDSLICELEILKKIVKDITDMPDEKICMVSDHGFTFLCLKKFGNFKRFDFIEAEHEGRCMWVDREKCCDDEDFITWDLYDGPCRGKSAVVALKHVSLKDTPAREVHGGATPEEVLVPLVILETKKEEIRYTIEPAEVSVWVTAATIVEVKIFPKPRHPPEAFFDREAIEITYKSEKGAYALNLNGFKRGEYIIDIMIGKNRYPLKVQIKSGYKERDLL
jgi:hypothetical protein